jgi:hypothetical protein
MTVSITNVINISLTATPQGLAEDNVNSLALFTTETPSNIDPFRVYLNASEVAADYGTGSTAAAMANAIFSQSPNILSGGGRLVTIPLIGSNSATQGDFASADIAVNLAAIQAVADGDIRVVLNGNDLDLTGLDFTGASDFGDIATILQSKLTDVIVTSKATGFDLFSKKVGTASTVDLVQLPAGSGTDLSVVGLFNTAGGVATAGGNAVGETLVDAIARTEEDAQYVGVITDLEMEDAVIKTTATAIQAKDMIFVHQFFSTEDLEPTTGICSQIKDATETKSRCVFYSVDPINANLAKSAYAGRAFSVNFAGSNTTSTMNLKSLVGIQPDIAVNQTILNKAEIAGADVYVNMSSLGVVLSNGANSFFDSVYNAQWFKFALEVALFNYLRQTNTKIPQTESGMNGLKGAAAKVADRGVNNQMIGVGLTWNSAETFGIPEDLKRNVTDKGYYIYSLPIAKQPQVDRDARKAPLVQIAIKEAGSIHSSDTIVVIER